MVASNGSLQTILIVDPHPVAREGLKAGIGKEFRVVGETGSMDKLLPSIETLRPDIVVTEAIVPRERGKEQGDIFQLLGKVPGNTKIVFYSWNDNPVFVARAYSVGARAYLPKSVSVKEMVVDLGRVACELQPEHCLLVPYTTRTTGQRVGCLTQREMQVLQLLGDALSNKEIGRQLRISVETVKEHVQNVLRKIGVTDRTKAAVWAVRQQLV